MRKFIPFLLILCLFLVGCQNPHFEVNEDKFNIVTSFYPIYVATSNIVDGIEGVTLENMADVQVGCLHDYQLTTKDMNKLERADAFIINGGDTENFLDKALNAYTNLNVVNSSEGILENSYDDSNEHDTENGHKHEHSGYLNMNENDEYDHSSNTHVWVSVSLYIEQVKNIANGLAKLNPDNADKYLKNCEEYVERLENLRDEMHDELDVLENRNIVTFHEAFEYFADEFDLNIVAVIEREPGTNPSAGELAKIIDKIKDTNAAAIFVEPQYIKSAANTIANETGISVYSLNPIVSGELDKYEYEKLMRENVQVIKEALKNEK